MNLPRILLRRVGPARPASSRYTSLRLPPLLQQYCRALREATRSRNRLTRLAPDIFSATALRDNQNIDDDQVAMQEVRDACARFMRKKKGLPALELPPEAAAISTSSPDNELDCPLFHCLGDAQKAAIQFEFTAYHGWKQLVDSARAQIETEENAWARLEPAHAAQVMHWRSLFEQAQLGVPVLSRKTGLLFEDRVKAKPSAGSFRIELFEKLRRAYPNGPRRDQSSKLPDQPVSEPKTAGGAENQPASSGSESAAKAQSAAPQPTQALVAPEEIAQPKGNASEPIATQKRSENTSQTPGASQELRGKKPTGSYISFKA